MKFGWNGLRCGWLFSLSFFLIACTSTSKLSEPGFTSLNAPEGPGRSPSFIAQHINDDSTRIWFSIPTTHLLYVLAQDSLFPQAKVRIDYVVKTEGNAKTRTDSSSVWFNHQQKITGTFDLEGFFDVKFPPGKTGVAEIIVTDLNRNNQLLVNVSLIKERKTQRQYFLLRDPSTKRPLFRNYVLPNEYAELANSQLKKGTVLKVHAYFRDYPLPLPPFSVMSSKPFDLRADSIFTLSVNQDGFVKLVYKREGMYHVLPDSNLRDGFTLYRFKNEFPLMAAPNAMVPVMRYLTTRQEYEDIMFASNPSKAMDDFWLRNAGNPDRARKQVKSYFTRAEYANLMFSSYVEGWKTDRGLIYTVFGEPNAIYRDAQSETWLYGEERSYRSLTFTFSKVSNPFSDNDYMLNRSDLYKDEWFKGVDTWRQGRVFNDRP